MKPSLNPVKVTNLLPSRICPCFNSVRSGSDAWQPNLSTTPISSRLILPSPEVPRLKHPDNYHTRQPSPSNKGKI